MIDTTPTLATRKLIAARAAAAERYKVAIDRCRHASEADVDAALDALDDAEDAFHVAAHAVVQQAAEDFGEAFCDASKDLERALNGYIKRLFINALKHGERQ